MATVTYKCPNCGGGLQFDPADQKYHCEYCRSHYQQQELDQLAPQQQEDQVYPSGQEQAMVHYNCPNCGAQIVTDETTAASFCYYCHNPVVLEGRLAGDYHPDCVIPFAIDREKAVEIFRGWIKKKKFVPRSFSSQEQIETMTGVYFPYWLYSCEVDGSLNALGIKRKTWVTGNIRFTETQRFDISREGTMKVENVTRNALKKANRQLVEGVLPFPYEKMQPFSSTYLSGFSAEKRDMEEQEFEQEVENEVRDFAVDTLKQNAGLYNELNVQDSRADIGKKQWKYALLPVWTLTYRDSAKDKIYYFAMNGQNGKVCGQLPVDKNKLIVLFFQIFMPTLFALLIAGYLI